MTPTYVDDLHQGPRILADLSRLLVEAGLAPNEILQSLCDSCVGTLCDFAVIFEVDESDETLHLAALADTSDDARSVPRDLLRGWNPRLGEGLTGGVAESGKTLYVPVVVQEEALRQVPVSHRQHVATSPTHSFIIAPIKARSRVFGTLTLGRTREGYPFSVDDVELVEEMALRTALMMDGAQQHRRALEELERRTQIQAALEESEALYRTLAELSPVAILVNQDGRLAYVNTAAATLLGSEDRSQLIGRAPREFIHPDFHQQAQERFRRAISDNFVNPPLEQYWYRLDGTLFDCEVSSATITWEGAPAVLLVCNDITQRKRVEKALAAALEEAQRQQRLYEAVTTSTPDLIYVFDLNYRLTYANHALLEMLGRSQEDAVNKTLRELGYEPWHAEMHEREIDQVIATRQPARGEMPFLHDKLGKRMYEYIFVPVLDDSGQVEAIAGTTRDITERKLAEERLREASELKDQFISLVSHELRTPITTILGNATILARRWERMPEADRQQALEDTVSEAGRLQGIVENLLLLTRLDVTHELEFQEFSLGELLQEQIELFRRRNPGREVTYDDNGDDPVVSGQRDLIAMLVDNLLSNASKYSPADSAIEITARRQEAGDVLVCVRDYGIGLKDTDLASLFTPFHRTAEGKQYASGMGLGLAVCKKIVEAHGGSIWAEQRPEGGSDFCFMLCKPVHR